MGSSETLRSVIDAGRSAKRLDELSTARVIGKIAEQIHQAQQRAGAGKAVGPITPAGILIDNKGSPKLGLAEPTAYAYASPEQLSGEQGDRRSDVFSLGVVMWEALTHRSLFDAGSEAATKTAVAERAIAAPSEVNANVPVELGTICMKALARNAADRYQSAKVMAAEIEAVLEDAGYGDSDEKIAAYVANLERDAAAAKRPGSSVAPKLSASVATAALPPPRRTGVTSSRLTVTPLPSQLPSVLSRPRVGPSTPAPKTVPDANAGPSTPAPKTVPDAHAVPSTAPGFSGAPGNTPAPTAAPAGATPSPVVTLIGASPAHAIPPAPLPPLPIQPLSSHGPVGHAPHAAPPSQGDGREAVPLPSIEAHAAAPQSTIAGRPATVPPHPADAVALPSKTRETELLDGWSWRTGAHPQVEQEDDPSDEPRTRNPMLYIIGGGFAVAGILVVAVMAMGGSKPADKAQDPQQPANAETTYDPHSVNATGGVPADASSTPDAPTPSADANRVVEEATSTDSAPSDPAPPAPPADTSATIDSTDSVDEDTKPARTKPPVKQTAKIRAKPPSTASSAKKNAELPYRRGLQLFMRGDTIGALSALRASLAANSNYAPAWRALGLVFEKMGDKDQARRSLRRYLQLAPGASDAEQIRNRLRKLGA